MKIKDLISLSKNLFNREKNCEKNPRKQAK